MRLVRNADSNKKKKQKKQVRTRTHTTQNPPMAPYIPDHYDHEVRRDKDARNLQFEGFPVGCSMWRKQQDPRGQSGIFCQLALVGLALYSSP